MAHLQSFLASVFNLHHNFQIKYQNEEGELIAITEDGDLEVAMKKGGCLRLFVVGDEANVAVSVVRDEEMNLGKKVKRSDKEFLGGKGRKFCRREKGEKKCGRNRRSAKSKCESNEPPEVSNTPQLENTSPVTSVQKDELLQLKSKLHVQKSKVLNIRLQIRNLKQHESTPKEKILEMKLLLTKEIEESRALRVQLKELRILMREMRMQIRDSRMLLKKGSVVMRRRNRNALKRKARRERRKTLKDRRKNKKRNKEKPRF